jgi:2-polyprenyl-6-methoxyphenol hydroxylase-like FAD-dependent oxidoreductase
MPNGDTGAREIISLFDQAFRFPDRAAPTTAASSPTKAFARPARRRQKAETAPALENIMSEAIDADVLIVGAGPVGLTLAIDLAQRGVFVTVAELRAASEPPPGRSNVVSARSMEAFRRLGIAQAVREAGLPADYPHDVAIRTSATGFELGRVRIPCRAERYTAKDGPDTWWPTPEPPHRINQVYLEPVLLAAAMATPRLRILNRVRVDDVEQRNDDVLATTTELDSNLTKTIVARYVVGCDGAHSQVRHAIGATLQGDAAVLQAQTSVIRAPGLLGKMPGPAWAIDCISPRHRGLVFAIDGRERWIVHKFAEPGARMSPDRERGVREILGVDRSFAFEIVRRDDWVGRRLLADRFQDRRIFLCGDAAHIWVPFAAYGMNAGIADALNLSWMLAAVIRGWGDPALLQAYEIERRPITEQVSRHAMKLAMTWERRYGPVPDAIEQVGPQGDAVRALIGRQASEIMAQGMCCGGLNFGYFYEDSPIIAYDREAAPDYTLTDFTQSTVPGCRTPHVWLKDGRSLYDALGPDFTLLRLDTAVEVESLLTAAARRRVPLSLLDVHADDAAELYPHKLLLSRPDRHVAWRGNEPPIDALALVDRVRGAPEHRPSPSS